MRTALQVIAGLVAIGAGVYLLGFSSGSIDIGGQKGRSWFDIIDHGMGAYFVARGIWMLATSGLQVEIADNIGHLVELQQWEADRAYEPDDDEVPEQPAG